nr:hypothetical protein [Tanacetum cinerariifolium]
MDHNIDFSGSDQIQNPQYPEVQENPLPNDEFEAFMKANDDKMNDLEIKFDQFQKQCEQMQDNLLNQMRNFIQNFQSGPPSEDKEHEAKTNMELLSTEDIHPLAIQEPPRESDTCQLIEECSVEVPEQQKQNMEKKMFDLVKIYEVTKSNAENLLPIPSECKVTLEDKRECDELICENSSTIDVCDNHSEILFDSNNDDLSSDDESFEDIEYVDASVPDPAIVSLEEENVVQREEEEVDLEDISQVQDVVLREKLFSITCLISNIESLNDNSIPDRERLINLIKNDVPDNSSNDPLLEEVDLFLSDDSIPPGIKNVADDPEGDIRFLEELLIDDSILSHELSDDNNPSIPRPPPEPPDVEFFIDLKPDVIAEEISDKLNEDK